MAPNHNRYKGTHTCADDIVDATAGSTVSIDPSECDCTNFAPSKDDEITAKIKKMGRKQFRKFFKKTK